MYPARSHRVEVASANLKKLSAQFLTGRYSTMSDFYIDIVVLELLWSVLIELQYRGFLFRKGSIPAKLFRHTHSSSNSDPLTKVAQQKSGKRRHFLESIAPNQRPVLPHPPPNVPARLCCIRTSISLRPDLFNCYR